MLNGCFFFFFKQKTSYEMRISDWSSDVCSSDLGQEIAAVEQRGQRVALRHPLQLDDRDLEHAILAAQRIAFATQRAQFVFEGIDGCKADLIDRDPCPPDAVHSTSPMRTQKRRRPDADDLCGDR